MGIQGFETVVEMNKGCSHDVDIKAIAHQYTERTGKTPVMVIDGSNFMKHFYVHRGMDFGAIHGGQLRSFIYLMKYFVNRLKEFKIDPLFYFDGPTVATKINTRQTRNNVKAKKLQKLFECINKPGARSQSFQEYDIFPLLLSVTGRFIVKYECNCVVRVSTEECDGELAGYAYRESCFAILSQDTDFLCMKNAAYYLSVKHLDLNEMKTKLYDRCAVLHYYSMTEQQMWLFGSLAGNDIIPPQKIKKFHREIAQKNGNLKKDGSTGKLFLPNHIKFRNIAQYVVKVTETCPNEVKQAVPAVINDLKEAAVDVNGNELEECLQSYQPSGMENWVTDESIQGPWLEILELAYRRHIECLAIPDVYGTLVGLPYEIGQFLEKPENPQVESSRIFLPLRQRIYSILLHEKPAVNSNPCHVKEFGTWGGKWHGLNNMEEVYVPEVRKDMFHPGLIALWTKDTERINLQRWTLFAKTICPDLDPSIFYRLHFHHVVPLAVLLYMKNPKAQEMQKQKQHVTQRYWHWLTGSFMQWWSPVHQEMQPVESEENQQTDFCLENYETDSFIKQAVVISYLCLLYQNRLLMDGIWTVTPRMVNLSTVFGYGISMVLFQMSALGFPLEKVMPWHYFDGPLFHYFLKEREIGCNSLAQLCSQLSKEDQMRIREDYETLKQILIKNTP